MPKLFKSRIRLKIILLVTATVVALSLLLHIVTGTIVYQGFGDLERREVLERMDQIEVALKNEINDVRKLSGDYATWNDTYDFVLTQDPTYLEVNMVNETFPNLRIQFILLMNLSGEIIFWKMHDPTNLSNTFMPAGLMTHLVLSDPLIDQALNGPGMAGLLVLNDGQVLVSSTPVLHSDGTGPVIGCMLMIRLINEGEKEWLEKTALAPLSVSNSSDAKALHDLGKREWQELNSTGSTTVVANESIINGYKQMDDIYGQHAVVLKAPLDRHIMAQARSSMSVLEGALILTSLLFGLFTLIVLDRTFVTRVGRLSEDVEAVGSKGNEKGRVEVQGRDEIARLASNINSMLDSIESKDRDLLETERRNREQLEDLVERRTEELQLANRGLANEVSAKLEKEIELRKSEQRYRAVVEDQMEMIVRMRPDGTINFVNQAFCRAYGKSEEDLVGSIFLPEGAKKRPENWTEFAERTTPENPAATREIDVMMPDGTLRRENWTARAIFDEQGRLVEIQSVGQDVTERMRLEEELFRTQRLESLGRMAGGIAHDYNNILTSILGNLTMTRMELERTGSAPRRFQDMESSLLRAKDLTQQLLTFSEGGSPVKEWMQLAPLVRSTAEMGVGGTDVHLKLATDEELWPVEADRGQLAQVVNNIVHNAVEAMPSGGTLIIHASNMEARDDVEPLGLGRFVKITFKDTGEGIKREHLQRVFDPFFTTKGNHSGLGLTAARSIVRKHGGRLEVDSEEGIGTTVHIYLPAAAPVQEAEPEIVGPSQGRVLLMDDEISILEIMSELISYLGYDVVSARDGQETLQLYSKAMAEGTGFDVVIMDLSIPGGMGGKEAVAKLLQLDPDARTIVSSGYSNDPVMAEYQKYGFVGVLQKPYTVKELGAALGRAKKVNKGTNSTVA